MSRWQLQKAGTREETHCRFCDCELPDWRLAWRTNGVPLRRKARFRVESNGSVVVVEATVGPDGRANVAEFESKIREVLRLDASTPLDFAFKCKTPDGNGHIRLDGAQQYCAAVHCALLHANKSDRAGTSSCPANIV